MAILTKELIEESIAEARRFMKKAEAAKEAVLSRDSTRRWQPSSKETAAVRRAALDLKMQLTEISQSTNG